MPTTLEQLSPSQRLSVFLVASNYYRDGVTPGRRVPAPTRKALAARNLIWTSRQNFDIGPTSALLQLVTDYAWTRLTGERLDQVRARATAYELPQSVGLELTVDGGVRTDVRHWWAALPCPDGVMGPYLTVLPATWWRGYDPRCDVCGTEADITLHGPGPVLDDPSGQAHVSCRRSARQRPPALGTRP